MAKAFKILPKNYLADFGEFESWAQGAASAPDGWISASSPFKIAQDTSTFKYGLSAAQLVGSAALGASATGVAGLYRTVPNGSDYQGRTFTLGIWAKSASTGPYIELNDGVSSKTLHLDGLNAFAFHTLPPMKIDYAATQIRVNLFATKASTVYFDSAVLCEGEELFLNLDTNIDISAWEPSLSLKQDQYEIAQREGSFVPDNHLQGKTIRVKGQVVGTDVTSARTHFDQLMEGLLSWQKNEKRNVYLYDDRIIEVFLKSFDNSFKNGLQFIPFSFSLANPSATSRGLAKLRKRQVIAGSVTEFNLPYNGTSESLPVISFIANQGGAITTCVLENLTTGENFAYVGTVPTGVALDIDCDLGTVLNSSADSLGNWSGDFLGLVRGTNNLRFSGSNCTINIDYYERFFS